MTLGRDGDLEAPLTVSYAVADARESMPGSATFEAGQDEVIVTIATGAEPYVLNFFFAVSDGEEYDLGEPAEVTVSGPRYMPGCLAPPTTEPPTLPRTGSTEGLWLSVLGGTTLMLGGFGITRAARARRRAGEPHS